MQYFSYLVINPFEMFKNTYYVVMLSLHISIPFSFKFYDMICGLCLYILYGLCEVMNYEIYETL
jgi:hypothetical protein